MVTTSFFFSQCFACHSELSKCPLLLMLMQGPGLGTCPWELKQYTNLGVFSGSLLLLGGSNHTLPSKGLTSGDIVEYAAGT